MVLIKRSIQHVLFSVRLHIAKTFCPILSINLILPRLIIILTFHSPPYFVRMGGPRQGETEHFRCALIVCRKLFGQRRYLLHRLLKACNAQVSVKGMAKHYWATPFKIITLPVEDFGKVHHRGSVNFQMHLTSVWFLDYVYHRGSKYFIQKCQMSFFTWNSHSPCIRCFLNLPQGVCGLLMELPIYWWRCC